MKEVLNDKGRISFDDFCRSWLYQALGWPEQQAIVWFRDCIKAYRAREAENRYPLPEEKCYAIEAEGSWPEMPQRLVLQWLPKDILRDFGENRYPMHDLPYVYIDPKHTVAILTRLSSARFECNRSDMLVRMACGYLPDHLNAEAQRSLIEAAEQRKFTSIVPSSN